MRKFEKISKEQFDKEKKGLHYAIEINDKMYDLMDLPERSTSKSAAYDLRSLGDYVIPPRQTLKIPTGLKVCMDEDDVFLIVVRSSLGVKKNISLANAVGVIDADYYNNPDNEGHFWLCLKNNGEFPFAIANGDRLCQGIFVKYGVTENDSASGTRQGGFGSTGTN